jgi:hypothetical protein
VLSLIALVWALVRGPFRRLEAVARFVMALSFGLVLWAVVSLVAVRTHRFSPWSVSLGVGVLALVILALVTHRHRIELETAADGAHGGGVGLSMACVTLGALYALYPTYFLLGGQDPGVYLLFSGWAARTGGLDLDLPWTDAAWQAAHGLLQPDYPGLHSPFMRGWSPEPSHLVPQFMHLFPCLLANAWSLGGIEGAVRGNTLVALLALANVFLLVRRFAGFRVALGAVFAVGLNPAFLWGARITLTEVLALLLNMLGLNSLLCARDTGARVWGAAAGAALGLTILNRLDAGISVVPLFGFAVAAALTERRLRESARVALLAYAPIALLGYIDGWRSAHVYFYDLVTRHALNWAIAANLALVGVSLAVVQLPARWVARIDGERLLFRLAVFVSVLFAVWLAFALSVLPHLANTGNALAARELTWYLTPVVWPLAALGLTLGLRKRAWTEWLPLLAFTGASVVAYTIRTSVVHEHIWASRRWLPHVIPLTLMLAAIGAGWLGSGSRARPIGRLTAAGAGAAYFVLCLSFARSFLFRSMLAGLPAAYERFARHIRSSGTKTPLVTSNLQLASMLTYLYDVPTMLTNERRKTDFARGKLAGWSGAGFGAFELGDVTEYSETFVGKYLEVVSDRPPRNAVDMPILFSLGPLGGSSYEVEVPASHPSLGTIVGRVGEGGSLVTTGRAGTLQNGPWMTLPPGQYEVDWLGRTWSAPKHGPSGTLDVIFEGGRRTLATRPLRLSPSNTSEAWLGGIEFSIFDAQVSGLEFRLQVEAETGLVLTRVRLRRVTAR